MGMKPYCIPENAVVHVFSGTRTHNLLERRNPAFQRPSISSFEFSSPRAIQRIL